MQGRRKGEGKEGEYKRKIVGEKANEKEMVKGEETGTKRGRGKWKRGKEGKS